MIYKNESNDIFFHNYRSTLIDYLKREYNYDDSPLVYSTKYVKKGDFTIKRPSSVYKNCKLVNGYPHFNVPYEILMEEINNFCLRKPLYNKNIIIRYGDTHLYNPIPKLNQVRNLIIANIFDSMIQTSGKKCSIYVIGDIDRKSMDKIVQRIDRNKSEEIIPKLINFISISDDINQKYLQIWKELNTESKEKIEEFMQKLSLQVPIIIPESSLYRNKELYNKIRQGIVYENGVRDDGTFKYPLQELMFILTANNKNASSLNVIGSNQTDHVLKVLDVMRENNLTCETEFLTYGICKNGDSREIEEWSEIIKNYIEKNHIMLDGELVKYQDFLKIIVASQGNTGIIDFYDLNKYKADFEKFKVICASRKMSFNIAKENRTTKINKENCDIINKMALANYYLNLAVKSGEQSRFFSYLYSVSREYIKNSKQYEIYSNLFYNFISSALQYICLDHIENFRLREVENKDDLPRAFERE